MKSYSSNKQLIFIVMFIMINSFVVGLIYPSFEWPDELYHLSSLTNQGDYNLFHFLLRSALGLFFPVERIVSDFSWQDNASFGYFSDSLRYVPESIFPHYYKIAHAGVWVVFFFSFLFLLVFMCLYVKRNSSRYIKFGYSENIIICVFLSYFLFPSVTYSLASMSSEFYFVLLTPVVVLLLSIRRFLWAFSISILLVFEDRSAIALLFFVVCAFVFVSVGEWVIGKKDRRFIFRANFALIVIFSCIIFSLLVKGYLLSFSGEDGLLFSMSRDVQYNSEFNSNPVYKMGSLISSLYFVGGNLSLRAFFFEYIAFVFLLCYVFYRVIKYSVLMDYLFFLSALIPPVVIVVIIPPLSQGRYYYYLLSVCCLVFCKYCGAGVFCNFRCLSIISFFAFILNFLRVPQYFFYYL